ncbi:hypothetical protein J6590_005655 [Homalodisca vitripennis]|nr:hypothetical protein J6590_005655 [Homalodisca vitripennis]
MNGAAKSAVKSVNAIYLPVYLPIARVNQESGRITEVISCTALRSRATLSGCLLAIHRPLRGKNEQDMKGAAKSAVTSVNIIYLPVSISIARVNLESGRITEVISCTALRSRATLIGCLLASHLPKCTAKSVVIRVNTIYLPVYLSIARVNQESGRITEVISCTALRSRATLVVVYWPYTVRYAVKMTRHESVNTIYLPVSISIARVNLESGRITEVIICTALRSRVNVIGCLLASHPKSAVTSINAIYLPVYLLCFFWVFSIARVNQESGRITEVISCTALRSRATLWGCLLASHRPLQAKSVVIRVNTIYLPVYLSIARVNPGSGRITEVISCTALRSRAALIGCLLASHRPLAGKN